MGEAQGPARPLHGREVSDEYHGVLRLGIGEEESVSLLTTGISSVPRDGEAQAADRQEKELHPKLSIGLVGAINDRDFPPYRRPPFPVDFRNRGARRSTWSYQKLRGVLLSERVSLR